MRTTPIEWNGQEFDAADPEPIAQLDIALTASTRRSVERALAAIDALDHAGTIRTVIVDQLLRRAEGVASSDVERIDAPSTHTAIALNEPDQIAPNDPSHLIAANLAIVTDAIDTREPLTAELVRQWHQRLMANRHLPPEQIGSWRTDLGWIGGPSPRHAAHIASPPNLIDGHMNDLIAFTTRDDLDPITLSAIAHAQFETIHPFSDGNGRIGRVLIANLLAQRCYTAIPPPLSAQIRNDIGGYQAGLTLHRHGLTDQWIRWFADAIWRSADIAIDIITHTEEHLARWRAQALVLRSDSVAHRIISLLPTHPVVCAQTVTRFTGVTEPAARTALRQLAELDIVESISVPTPTTGRPRHWYAATALLELTG